MKFLTALCMFDNTNQNRGAKPKINEVLRSLNGNDDIMNIDLIYDNYPYWNEILKETQYRTEFDELTKRYVKLFR